MPPTTVEASLAAMRATVLGDADGGPADGNPVVPTTEERYSIGDFIEAAGLLSYDPGAITRIYAGHPQRLLRRLWQTLVPIGIYLLAVASDRLSGAPRSSSMQAIARSLGKAGS